VNGVVILGPPDARRGRHELGGLPGESVPQEIRRHR